MPEPPQADSSGAASEEAFSEGAGAFSHLSTSLSVSGPLPPPFILEQYDQIVPGAAERIIAMAEKQAAHRQAMEKKLLEAEIRDLKSQRAEARLGQVFGLVIGVVAILSGAVVATVSVGTAGQISGGLIGAGGVVGLVSVFVLGRKLGQDESARADTK